MVEVSLFPLLLYLFQVGFLSFSLLLFVYRIAKFALGEQEF